ncbi:MAG TPA: hypothetical protein VNK03_07325 [Gammaproteobacteria bacterium]|nr:hypothetical protein [Gammaproteobacteria bacterium]
MKDYTIANTDQLDKFLKLTESEWANLQTLELAFGLQALRFDTFQIFCNTLPNCIRLQTLIIMNYRHTMTTLVGYQGATSTAVNWPDSPDDLADERFKMLCAALTQCDILTAITRRPNEYHDMLTTIANNHRALIRGIPTILDAAFPQTFLPALRRLVLDYTLPPDVFPKSGPMVLFTRSKEQGLKKATNVLIDKWQPSKTKKCIKSYFPAHCALQ